MLFNHLLSWQSVDLVYGIVCGRLSGRGHLLLMSIDRYWETQFISFKIFTLASKKMEGKTQKGLQAVKKDA